MKKCSYCGKEFSDDLDACPTDGYPPVAQLLPGPPPLPGPGSKPPATRLAKASLILGILSLVCGPFLGLPAVICGHRALDRKNKFPRLYGGDGIAVAGLVTGYIGICVIGLAFMAAVAVPNFVVARQRALENGCVNNLKQIGLATRLWESNHTNSFPGSLMDLSNELVNPNVLICPADPNRKPAFGGPVIWNSNNMSYEFLATGKSNMDESPQMVIVRCPIHGTELLADGSVQMVRKR